MFGDVSCCDRGGDSAAWSEFGDECHRLGLHGRDDIVENAVRDHLVEDAFVAVLLQVHFQAFEFDTLGRRRVVEGERAEVGLACFRAHRGKLGTLDLDRVVALRVLILERFEHFLEIVAHGMAPVNFSMIAHCGMIRV
jgi:hypothetical protein